MKIDSDTALLFFLGTIGLLILGVAEELIIIYLSIELVSLTFYILACLDNKGELSTEAGLKYFIIGAVGSGILLIGTALIYSKTGVTSYLQLELIQDIGIGGILVIIAILLKLAVAPFHM